MKNKTFVLDTNVLIHDPEAMTKFPLCHVVLPLTVIEELDRLKKNPAEVGKNARAAVRYIDEVTRASCGNLNEGIQLPNGSRLRVEIVRDFQPGMLADTTNPDNWIIMACLRLKQLGSTQVVFVSKDLAARVKALSFGLEAEDYENDKVQFESIYSGYNELKVGKELLDYIRKDGALALEKIPQIGSLWNNRQEPIANEYFRLTDDGQGEVYVRYDARRGVLIDLPALPKSIWGLKPRNTEQRCALDALLDDKIPLVTLLGTAGTGKTLIALAAALRKVFDESSYTKILVSRPIVPLGKDIGYLPGSKDEKLFHWMQPIYDNLEFLCQSEEADVGDIHRWVLESRKIEMEAVTYIRGRSLPKIFFIIDEVQNLTPHEVKTIISRAGEGTKVVLTGDPTQIDNPYLDRDYNALTYTIGRFQNQPLYSHLQLAKTERSELAALAAKIM